MIIRDGRSTAELAQLRRGLAGREATFVHRESLPECTVAWDAATLPRVLVSTDIYDELQRALPGHFASVVLRPIRELVTTRPLP